MQTVSKKSLIKVLVMACLIMVLPSLAMGYFFTKKRVGIIGLDTSHSLAFTKMLNAVSANPSLLDYQVVAAYPYGSKDLELSKQRIPTQIAEIQKYGVKITGSIAQLLQEVDVVLLETNDGRLHKEQALEVIRARKPLFIDKPLATSYKDGAFIFSEARKLGVPIFSASSLRFVDMVKQIRSEKYGKVLGADTFSPATIEPSHPDLFWYGIHGVEMLFAVMGADCLSVTRFYTDDVEVVVGKWKDGRIGTFRGTRKGKSDFGGVCFTEEGTKQLGPYLGYEPLLLEIVQFFETGISPVDERETLAILAFMEAADKSRQKKGKEISLKQVLKGN